MADSTATPVDPDAEFAAVVRIRPDDPLREALREALGPVRSPPEGMSGPVWTALRLSLRAPLPVTVAWSWSRTRAACTVSLPPAVVRVARAVVPLRSVGGALSWAFEGDRLVGSRPQDLPAAPEEVDPLGALLGDSEAFVASMAPRPETAALPVIPERYTPTVRLIRRGRLRLAAVAPQRAELATECLVGDESDADAAVEALQQEVERLVARWGVEGLALEGGWSREGRRIVGAHVLRAEPGWPEIVARLVATVADPPPGAPSG